MWVGVARWAVLPASVVLLAGCGSGSTATRKLPTTPSATVSQCPGENAAPVDAWPAGVPAGFPTFAGQTITSSSTVGPRTTVTFTTPQSLRESVLAILNSIPAAGYVLGRGEAEVVDAEAPFSSRATNGAFRVLEVDTCESQWLLVLEPRGQFAGQPTPLITYSPKTSASAFGN